MSTYWGNRKRCRGCNRCKSREFYDWGKSLCNDCTNRKEEKETITIKLSLRDRLIHKLGGKCQKCGFSDKRALQIDHVDGGGNKHRKTIHPTTFYRQILNDTVEIKVQLLCANCNFIKRYENKEIIVK